MLALFSLIACGGSNQPNAEHRAALSQPLFETEHKIIDRRSVSKLDVDKVDKPPANPDRNAYFGDLHVHTSFSVDATLTDTPVSTGTPYTTPADACDFARYCSALDFWSINDHAEGLTPWQWDATHDAIRQCDAVTDPDHPDMVSFLGWEWTQGPEDGNPQKH